MRSTNSTLIFSTMLLAVIALPIIVINNNAFAIPSITGGGISSKDKCFEGGIAGINRIRPHYAEIHGTLTIEGTVVEAHVSHEDVPFDHWSHDRVWHVRLDPRLSYLNSISNDPLPDTPRSSKNPADKTMEMEWEIGTANDGGTDRFPKEFWPSDGDRVWMMGRYIFDCGHPEEGPRTELHPVTAVASTHFEPLQIPTASPGSLPIFAAKTSIYIHGDGGYYKTPVGGRSYEFDVILPPKPSPTSKLVSFIIDTPFGGPLPIITGPFERSGTSENYIHVNYDLNSMAASPSHKFGAHIGAGWTDPPQSNVYHYLTVSFDSITKRPSVNARLQDHTWEQQWVSVNGKYIELLTPSIGFKSVTDPDKKLLSSRPSLSTIIAEHSIAPCSKTLEGKELVPCLGSELNIKTTGWLRSGMDRNCFGAFRTQDLSDGADLYTLITESECRRENTNPESLGSVIQSASIGKGPSDLTFDIGPMEFDVCSGQNKLLKTTCEFTLQYTVTDTSGPVVVSSSASTQQSTPPTQQPTPPIQEPAPPPTKPIPSTCDPKSKTIKNGSSGPLVIELQEGLTQLGYGDLLGPPRIDGKFGPYTESAVKKFQKDKALKVDGIVGPNTWTALCDSLSLVEPTDMIKEMKDNYHQISLEQAPVYDSQSNSSIGEEKVETETEEEEELETDWPKIDFDMLTNLSKAELISSGVIRTENGTTIATPVNETFSSENNGTLNETALPPAVTGEKSEGTESETTPLSPQEQLVCNDGNSPDASGVCADGTQPQAFNATTGVTPPLTEQQQQLVCSDGFAPDPSTGLCADSTQPQNTSAVTLEQQQALVCSDGSAPDSTTGLCADGTQPQAFNATTGATPPLTEQQQQLVCSDGFAPDPSSGLCADGI